MFRIRSLKGNNFSKRNPNQTNREVQMRSAKYRESSPLANNDIRKFVTCISFKGLVSRVKQRFEVFELVI